MRCFHHPDEEAIGACALCGHPLCHTCANEVDRVFYCGSCLSSEKPGEPPPHGDAPGSRSAADPYAGGRAAELPPPSRPHGPAGREKHAGTAVFLSIFLPFSGQIYNNQFAKALTFLLLFISCIILAGKTHLLEGLFGAIAVFLYFYQIYDAYKTARSEAPSREPSTLVPAVITEPGRGGAGETAPDGASPRTSVESPVWGISLILLGFVFLLDNFGLIRLENLVRLWPLAIIGVGLAMILTFYRGSRTETR